jgi:programmed cell death 6-interacting protein
MARMAITYRDPSRWRGTSNPYIPPYKLILKEYLNDHIPSTTTSSSTYSSLPPSVRPLRSSLEELDDNIAHRSRIISECKQIASSDDVRPEVLKEASRLAHGGTGDVKTERLKVEMEEEGVKQDELLEKIRVSPSCARS